MNIETLNNRLRAIKIVPVIALERAEDAVPLGRTLQKNGIPVAEITFRSAVAIDAIRRLRDALPRTRVEVEQVEVTQDLSPEQVARTAEEIVAKQKAEADGAATVAAGGSATAEAPATTEAAGESAAHGLGARRAVTLGRAMGRSLLHRARRGGLGPR